LVSCFSVYGMEIRIQELTLGVMRDFTLRFHGCGQKRRRLGQNDGDLGFI